MYGGELTDYQQDLYRVGEWADKLEKENPLLAQQMCDLLELLTAYDEYLSGDIDDIEGWFDNITGVVHSYQNLNDYLVIKSERLEVLLGIRK